VTRRSGYAGLVILAVIGIVALVSGIDRYHAAQPVAGGRTTTGTIVAVNTGQHCGRHGCSTYWVPTIQFTANGGSFSFAGPESSSSMNTGDQVQVSYDPNDPDTAHDLSAGEGAAWFAIIFGVVAILIGAGGFVRARLRARDS